MRLITILISRRILSFYIKTKFLVGQQIYSIKEDKIVLVIIESISISTDGDVCYLAKNKLYSEKQSFLTKEEAEEFINSSYRIPFVTGDRAWIGNSEGVRPTMVNGGKFYFNEDKNKPYNRQIHADNILNITSCYEKQLEATEIALDTLKLINEFNNKTNNNLN